MSMLGSCGRLSILPSMNSSGAAVPSAAAAPGAAGAVCPAAPGAGTDEAVRSSVRAPLAEGARDPGSCCWIAAKAETEGAGGGGMAPCCVAGVPDVAPAGAAEAWGASGAAGAVAAASIGAARAEGGWSCRAPPGPGASATAMIMSEDPPRVASCSGAP